MWRDKGGQPLFPLFQAKGVLKKGKEKKIMWWDKGGQPLFPLFQSPLSYLRFTVLPGCSPLNLPHVKCSIALLSPAPL